MDQELHELVMTNVEELHQELNKKDYGLSPTHLTPLEIEGIKDFIYLCVSKEESALGFYGGEERFGKWCKLARALQDPYGANIHLSSEEVDYLGEVIEALIMYLFSTTISYYSNNFRSYLFELVDLLHDLKPFCNLSYLFSDVSSNNRNLEQVRSNFMNLYERSDVVQFYSQGIEKGPFLQLEWPDFKRVVMFYKGQGLESDERMDSLITLDSLGTKKIESLIEAGYCSPRLVSIYLDRGLNIKDTTPEFMHMVSKCYAERVSDIHSAVQLYPSCGELRQYYLYERFNTKEYLVKFKELPVFVRLMNILLLKSGFGGLGLFGKPTKPL